MNNVCSGTSSRVNPSMNSASGMPGPTGRTTNLLSPASTCAEIRRRAPAHPSATSDSGAIPGRRRATEATYDSGSSPNDMGRLIPK
jgi:hypothetical protein